MDRRMTVLSLLILFAVVTATGLTHSTSAMMPDSGPSASGHGNLTTGGELRTFSFTAVTHKDGTVTGQAQLISRATDTRIHMEIDCLRVVGNIAIMSGTITNSNVPAFEGRPAIFRVQDNGEGANDPADRISLVSIFPAGFAINCNSNFSTPLIPIDGGNIQVRP